MLLKGANQNWLSNLPPFKCSLAPLHHGIPNDPQRSYAVISLSKRVLTQCDSQVSKLNRFAFALAEVAVRVAVFEPKFGVVLIALLHEACVLAVPKYYPFVQGRYASDEAGSCVQTRLTP